MRRPGFWLQSITEDGDPATSDGLRVDTVGVPALVAGDVVAVRGTVSESPLRERELAVTRLVEASWTIVERGRGLPPSVTLVPARADSAVRARGASPPRERAIPSRHVDDDGLSRYEPEADAIDFFESLEGMRVAIPRAVVVGPTSSYRECVVLAGDGAHSEVRSWRGGVIARPGDDDPERVTVDTRLLEDVPRVVVGDVFQGTLSGVVDYAFGVYRVMLVEPPPPLAKRTAPRDRTSLRGDDRHLTVATWNVLDLGMDDDAAVFRSIARGIVEDLGSPDLIALQEIQDRSGRRDDGAVDGAPTLERLLGAIREAGGPSYDFLQVDPRNNQDGGVPGANIRVALLFEPSRLRHSARGSGDAAAAVVPGAGGPALSASPARVEPSAPAWLDSRKPLAAELSVRDRPLFVVANHFVSKNEDDPSFGAVQPAVPHSERRRREQARLVAALARDLLEAEPMAWVVVLGDLNEHWFGDALRPLVDAGLEPLVERVPLPERYTYNFRGLSQVLDHVYVSAALAAGAEVDLVHTNADFPAWRRASDHDAVVVRLRVF